jgi:hypothetical protein
MKTYTLYGTNIKLRQLKIGMKIKVGDFMNCVENGPYERGIGFLDGSHHAGEKVTKNGLTFFRPVK